MYLNTPQKYLNIVIKCILRNLLNKLYKYCIYIVFTIYLNTAQLWLQVIEEWNFVITVILN